MTTLGGVSIGTVGGVTMDAEGGGVTSAPFKPLDGSLPGLDTGTGLLDGVTTVGGPEEDGTPMDGLADACPVVVGTATDDVGTNGLRAGATGVNESVGSVGLGGSTAVEGIGVTLLVKLSTAGTGGFSPGEDVGAEPTGTLTVGGVGAVIDTPGDGATGETEISTDEVTGGTVGPDALPGVTDGPIASLGLTMGGDDDGMTVEVIATEWLGGPTVTLGEPRG